MKAGWFSTGGVTPSAKTRNTVQTTSTKHPSTRRRTTTRKNSVATYRVTTQSNVKSSTTPNIESTQGNFRSSPTTRRKSTQRNVRSTATPKTGTTDVVTYTRRRMKGKPTTVARMDDVTVTGTEVAIVKTVS